LAVGEGSLLPPRLLRFHDSVVGVMMLLLCWLLTVPVLLLMAVRGEVSLEFLHTIEF
jgi:hypothetical protein